jgi:hypothetical protein
MNITLDPKLEAALREEARHQGIDAKTLAMNAPREKFVVPTVKLEPQDEWERAVLALAMDCGAGLSDKAVSSEAIYE